MIKNEKIGLEIRNKLAEVYTLDPIDSLSRIVSHWTSAEFGFKVLGTGGTIKTSREFEKQNTNWIDRVNLLEDIIRDYCDESKYFIIFDELDEDYRPIKSDDHISYNYLLTSLFKAVQDIKSIFRNSKQNICPIIFLRDDIYSLIKDADKNKWRDFQIEIEWNNEKIQKLLAYRISKDAQSDKTLDFKTAWYLLFASKVEGGSRKIKIDSFEFITRSTQLRPRDYIRYIRACAEETINFENFKRDKIYGDTIKKVDYVFSNYLRDEIIDEIYPLLPDIHEIFQIISNMRKQTFSAKEFETEYLKYLRTHTITEENIDFVLSTLYKYSVIGNIERNRNYKNYFRYTHNNLNLNKNEKLVVHRGLLKALQL